MGTGTPLRAVRPPRGRYGLYWLQSLRHYLDSLLRRLQLSQPQGHLITFPAVFAVCPENLPPDSERLDNILLPDRAVSVQDQPVTLFTIWQPATVSQDMNVRKIVAAASIMNRFDASLRQDHQILLEFGRLQSPGDTLLDPGGNSACLEAYMSSRGTGGRPGRRGGGK